MNNAFRVVTKENPCPICGKTDWCMFGDRAVKCMRVESSQACLSGGWYHFYSENKIAPLYIHKRPTYVMPTKQIECEFLMSKWKSETTVFQFKICADNLGIIPEALIGLGAAYAKEYKAWAFPMKNEKEETVGIRLRNSKGDKWAVKGSRQGVFIPTQSVHRQDVIFLPEGPTDTAALLTLGLYAIGRPSCLTGNDILHKFVFLNKCFRVVIVSDNDELKQYGNKQARPGIEGANKLKSDLKNCISTIWIPPSPAKDIREFVKMGGTKEMIESDLKSKIWSK